VWRLQALSCATAAELRGSANSYIYVHFSSLIALLALVVRAAIEFGLNDRGPGYHEMKTFHDPLNS
jgi:1,4-dihydroxy-2-naphthoate octaprenyltransferase